MSKIVSLAAGLVLLFAAMAASAQSEPDPCVGLKAGVYEDENFPGFYSYLSCEYGGIFVDQIITHRTFHPIGDDVFEYTGAKPSLFRIRLTPAGKIHLWKVGETSSPTILRWVRESGTSHVIRAGTFKDVRDGAYRKLSQQGDRITVTEADRTSVYEKGDDGIFRYTNEAGEKLGLRVVSPYRAQPFKFTETGEISKYIDSFNNFRIGDLSLFDQEQNRKREAQFAVYKSRYPSLYQNNDDYDDYDDDYADQDLAVPAPSAAESAFQFLQNMADSARRDANERAAIDQRYQDRLADLRRQQQQQSTSSSSGGNANNYGARVVAQEQARAEALRREREQREQAERRLAEQQAQQQRARAEEARLAAERERTRPVEWVEGVVLCEPRSGSKQWRCTGPLQTNVLELDAPNTIAQLGLACGSANGIREIGQTGGYRAYGCGFGIHPTAKNYPGNRDVPADFGVYVGDRRVFHCPTSKDAYCRNP